jgi:ubiquinone/menaquinone biosynthesis C-methylase UbiE
MNRISYLNQRLPGENMLEVGCGNKEHWRVAEDYNLRQDIQDFGQNIVWNLEEGIPLPDNFCKAIYASNIFEHLHPDKLVYVMNECWRVLTIGGELWITVPDHLRDTAYIPSHLIRFTEATFKFFTGSVNNDYELRDLHSAINQTIKIWGTISLVTNDRGDIHWKASPKGKI